jgi:prevent-host-death family protein
MQATEMSETCTLAEFQEHVEEHINRVARTRQPMFVASNGAPDVVLLDVESYQQMLETIDRAEAIEGIRQGLESMRQGKGRPAQEFLEELRQKYNIPAKQ